MHILSANQFTPGEMDQIFGRADEIRKKCHTIEGRRYLASLHQGQQICSVFYEASTRTKASFELAAIKLGMGVYETENAGKFSSVAKGETIEDTIRVLSGFGVSAIVLRTKEEGLAARAAKVSRVPIINAGDGKGEHPTQALLDAYTIKREKGALNGLKIVMGGDLAHGRTVRSLSHILAQYPDNEITFISIPELQISEDIKSFLTAQGVKHKESSDMFEPLRSADVVYWTRLQKERLADPSLVPEDGFVIDSHALKVMNKAAILMHPLPRVGEISLEVDNDPRAKYFEQTENGLYIRMALLDNAAEVKNNS
jgi:aspartate carbamoyltransferase catalytic subunit